MYLTIPILTLLALAFAFPHDAPSPDRPVVTETIFVTVTHTLDESSTSTSSGPNSTLITTSTSSCTNFSHIHNNLAGSEEANLPPLSSVVSNEEYASAKPATVSLDMDGPTNPDTFLHDPVGWGGIDGALFTSSVVSMQTEAVASKHDDTSARPTASSSGTPAPTTMSTLIHDPVGWAGIDGALFTSLNVQQDQERYAATTPTQSRYWGRFFVGAMTLPRNFGTTAGEEKEGGEYGDSDKGCILCPKGRGVVCINATHFGYCDEGCVEARRLKKDMKCEDGRVYGSRTVT